MSDAVAVVAAHPDDEVLGCGGTLARMASEGRSVHVLFVSDGQTSRRIEPGQPSTEKTLMARTAAAKVACAILNASSVEMLALPDNSLDGVELLDVVRHIESFVQRHRPSLLLTHHCGDVNIDHRVVHDAVISACRPQPGHPVKELLFFEVPSSTEWRPAGSAHAFNPNYFVDISKSLPKKLEALNAYAAELRPFPHPRSIKAVTALANWRGAMVGVEAAEAFVLGRRLVS
jgi:LmbE family N-acetylglucosaminyl deacetylase